jgi:hypothetical protein
MRMNLRRGFVVLTITFAVAQFFRPDRTNPPINPQRSLESRFDVPPSVRATLRRACYDCHSSETRWPWYTNISPVSWFVTNHVNGGRNHLNFDEWDRLRNSHEQAVGFRLVCREMKGRAMPLSSYLWIHWNARLSDNDINEVCAWTTAMQKTLGQPDTSSGP